MIGIYVSVPIACFRKGFAREYLETEVLPPPSTCYGFLLSLVGETDRDRHVGVRLTPSLVSDTETSVVLRTVWRVKTKPLGSSGNTRPDYQQLLTGCELVIWLDSSDENQDEPTLESRVTIALDPSKRSQLSRFGGLSLGESTHLVNEVRIAEPSNDEMQCFVLANTGRMTLPVWVDHVGSSDTNYATGNIEKRIQPPELEELPVIRSRD